MLTGLSFQAVLFCSLLSLSQPQTMSDLDDQNLFLSFLENFGKNMSLGKSGKCHKSRS